jgi:hypothetical protein
MIRHLLRLALGRFVRGRLESRDPDDRLLAFARGLALGALVGAAIAGSGLWSSIRRRRGG